MSKDPTRRSTLLKEQEKLRHRYATQPMSFEEYRRKMKALLKRQEKRG